MANRNFTEFGRALEKEGVSLYAYAAIGATGAPTLQQWKNGAFSAAPAAGWKGIKSITRNAVGKYTIVLQDTYQHVLQVSATFLGLATAAAPAVALVSDGVGTLGTPNFVIQCQSSGGTGADPANGETMLVEVKLSNSTAI